MNERTENTANMKEMSSSQIDQLLHDPIPVQYGPLRFYDKEMRCIVSGRMEEGRFVKNNKGKCNSPTHIKLQGIPTCSMHALRKMNELLIEMEVE